jgi:hypothetical protein
VVFSIKNKGVVMLKTFTIAGILSVLSIPAFAYSDHYIELKTKADKETDERQTIFNAASELHEKVKVACGYGENQTTAKLESKQCINLRKELNTKYLNKYSWIEPEEVRGFSKGAATKELDAYVKKIKNQYCAYKASTATIYEKYNIPSCDCTGTCQYMENKHLEAPADLEKYLEENL